MSDPADGVLIGRGGQGSDTHRGEPGGHGEETAVHTPRKEASGGPALPTPGSGVPASRPGDLGPAVSVAGLCFAFAGALNADSGMCPSGKEGAAVTNSPAPRGSEPRAHHSQPHPGGKGGGPHSSWGPRPLL